MPKILNNFIDALNIFKLLFGKIDIAFCYLICSANFILYLIWDKS